ncbi:L-lysine 2,3-aminomutase [Candidatus Anstonella stagnisolia]|nr:L-lysine 2,3-aminomutase [Candidatus Anstonella stagnisolia]
MSGLKILRGSAGFDDFAKIVRLTPVEKTTRAALLQRSFMPFQVPESYARTIASLPEPSRTQMLNIVLPPEGERFFTGRFDPYGNKLCRQEDHAFLQHKYENTLLFHVDDFCIGNCQFCFKVNEIRTEITSNLDLNRKMRITLEYLTTNPGINNVLATGGDPVAFRNTRDLIKLIDPLISHPNIRVVRLATKGLAYAPERFEDGELLQYLKEVNRRPGKQITVIAQMNHPAEFTESAKSAIRALQEAGVQIRGQPAIVKGVNDSVETLIELQRAFVDNQIVSYYLTVFMPVKGVEQYGLPLDCIFRNVAESKRHLSGLEKKGILLASHDFGKLEICGFYPSPERPEKIILKWHQIEMEPYLPKSLKDRVPTRPEDLMILDYRKGEMYCIDHVFKANKLPYFDSAGNLVEPEPEGHISGNTQNMQPERTIRQYLNALESGSYRTMIQLFSSDAIVHSPLYGDVNANEYYSGLFNDTTSSKISFLNIFTSQNPSRAAGHFRYDWTLKNGGKISFQCVDVFQFDETGKIKDLTIIYDTAPIRSSFQEMKQRD